MEAALSWNDLANLYDKANNGRKARTLPFNTIFEWAEKQEDKFKVTDEGKIYHKQ